MADQTISLKFNGYWRDVNRNSITSKPGIYCAYACTYKEQADRVSISKLLYVGESDETNRRLNKDDHPELDACRESLKSNEELCFSCAIVENENTRKRAEAALIYHYQTPFNTKCKDSFSYDKTTIITDGKNVLIEEPFTERRTD